MLPVSLRDYFAGQALARLSMVMAGKDGEKWPARHARICYEVADAMIRAREK